MQVLSELAPVLVRLSVVYLRDYPRGTVHDSGDPMIEEEKSRQRIKQAAYRAEMQQHPGERGDDYFKDHHKPDPERLKKIWRIEEALRACWRH